MSTPENIAEFTRMWERDGPRLAAYARRHVAVEDAPDIVAETFLLAWRRWDAVPHPPIAWLVGAARKIIGNHRRAARRRTALHERLVLLDAAACSASDAGVLATERMAALEALARLPEDQREALLLVTWDGLSPDEAATILNIGSGALRVRVHRARKALGPTSTPQLCAAAATTTLHEGGSA